MKTPLKFLLLILITTFVNQGECNSKQTVEEILAIADIKVNGDRPTDIRVLDERFYDRVLKDGSLGFGESYMEGWWDTKSLDDCMCKILRADLQKKVKPSWEMIWNVFKAKVFNMQGKSLSPTVVKQHYELGDDLYEKMLGESLSYSCAYWKNCATLEEAQSAKFDLIAKKMGLKKGMKVLDIGSGWGGFAKHIAKNYGVEVVAVNLSEKQSAYTKKLCEGLPVEMRNQDYRDIQGKFDRIITIGFFEHVGEKNYKTLMEIMHRCLADDGLVLLHTIGRNITASTTDPWINKYIFPHGHLPSITQIGEAMEGLFVMEDWHNFSANYDATLVSWYKNFEKNWDQFKSQYPESFYKMWKYYLLSCAGAFRARDIQLWQIVLSKNGVMGGYESVR